MSKKRYSLVFGIFFGIFLFSYSMGATYKMSDDQTRDFLKQFSQTTQGIGSIGIFVHNAAVAIPMFVPVAGIGWGVYTAGSTGASFSALAATNPDLANVSPLAFLILAPFGIMELVAYSIGMSRSFHFIWAIIKKNPLKKEIRPTLIELSIVASLLLVAGVIESIMINNHI
ncbi:MAG: stage II sporulation protein M [Nitrosopumilales archaeon]|nr:MAG: stage II sporulation protein M [Nitrosopumilales archaeon]